MEKYGVLDTALRPHLEAVTEYYRKDYPPLYKPESLIFKTNDETETARCIRLKNDSDRYRCQGNQFLKAEDFGVAIQLYTKSIAAAIDGPLASMAYNNRSVTLFKMACYEDSIVDIDRALESGYPNKQKLYTLYFRKAKCQKFLNKDYADCLADVYKAIRDHNDNDEFARENRKSEIEKAVPDLTVKIPIPNNWVVPELSYGQNREVPCFSSAVSLIHSDEELGRHIVANRSINTGDVLSVEEACVSCSYMTNSFNFCSLCFRHCNTLIPCLKCGFTMYCTETCRDSAWTLTHQFECREVFSVEPANDDALFYLLDEDTRLHIYEKILATLKMTYRMISRLGIDYIKKMVVENRPIHSLYPGNPRTRGFKDGKFQITSLEAFLSLDDYIEKSLMNYSETAFECCENLKIPSDELLPMASFFRKLQWHMVLQSKTLNCLKVNYNAEAKNLVNVPVGQGFYLASSLVNHSCDPNMYQVMYGTTVVWRAMRPVSKGEQLTISYNDMPATKFGYEERQEDLLKWHFFKCRCTACVGCFAKLECLPPYPQGDQMDQWFKDAGIDKKTCSELKHFCSAQLPATKQMLPKLLTLLQFCQASGQTSNRWYYNLQETIENHFRTEGSCILFNDAQQILNGELPLKKIGKKSNNVLQKIRQKIEKFRKK